MKKQKLKHRRKEATGDGGRQEAGTQMRKWVFFLSCLIRRFPLLITFCIHWSFISLSAYVHTYTYVRPSVHSHHRSVHVQSSPSSPSTPFIKCSIIPEIQSRRHWARSAVSLSQRTLTRRLTRRGARQPPAEPRLRDTPIMHATHSAKRIPDRADPAWILRSQ